jgi:hypothetical protein
MRSDALWHPLDAENYRESSVLQPGFGESGPKARFPIDLPFRYNAGDQTGFSGAGRVVNIGSSDVTVACRHQLKAGTPVELVIEWPARLNGRIPIHLVMTGRVMRCDASGFAVGACQYRFQLVGGPSCDEQPDPLTLPVSATGVEIELRPASDSSIPCVPRLLSATRGCRPAISQSAQSL